MSINDGYFWTFNDTSSSNGLIFATPSAYEKLLDAQDKIFDPNTREFFAICYETNKILKFESKEAYKKYLDSRKFNNEFEGKLNE